ncbi:MAG: transporter substrate-binding domain-containing protein [Chlamydiota bacterium]
MLTRFFFFPFLLLSSCILFLSSCGEIKNDTYEIALDPFWASSEFKDKDNNVLGFSTELLRMISRDEKMSFSLLSTNWDSLFPGLDANLYQAILSSLYPYNFNLQRYDFSKLYLPTGPVLILPVSSPYHSLNEINGKQVAVLENSPAVLLLENYPKISISTCGSVADIINKLQSGQVVGALLPLLTARGYTRGAFKTQFTIASPPLNDEGLRLITKKNAKPLLIKKFNKGLDNMKKDGRYESLLAEWDLNLPPPS